MVLAISKTKNNLFTYQYVPVVGYKITILIDAGPSIIGQLMQQIRLDNKKIGKTSLIVLFLTYCLIV